MIGELWTLLDRECDHPLNGLTPAWNMHPIIINWHAVVGGKFMSWWRKPLNLAPWSGFVW